VHLVGCVAESRLGWVPAESSFVWSIAALAEHALSSTTIVAIMPPENEAAVGAGNNSSDFVSSVYLLRKCSVG